MHARRITLAIGVVLGAVLIAVAAMAVASPSLTIQAPTPKFADQMTNIDVLRQEIKNYYGDPAGTGNFAADSNYANEASKVASQGSQWLKARAGKEKKPAIVLDVDDTTLATYNYEIASNWAYSSSSNAQFVNGELFPAVPGMVDMVNQAKAEGYAIIFVTGRPGPGTLPPAGDQHAVTIANLTKVGYPAPTALSDGSDGLFTKPPLFLDPPTNLVPNPDYPAYLRWCNTPTPTTSCNTDEYKSATRQYIESLGYEIVANFGDQYSDMSGGFEDKTFKLPNPSYFLP